MATQTLSQRLRAAVESRHSRHHAYYDLWRKGQLSREAIAGWVQEHYHFTKDIPWLLGPMLTDVPYPEVREMFRHNVEEEMDPRDPHINVLLRFGDAMGLDIEAVKRSKPLPTTQALLDWIYILTRHRSMVEAIAGLNIGLESQPPTLYGDIIPVLREKYGCTDTQITYFPLHVEADTEHGSRAFHLVEKFATSPDLQERAVLAAREGAEKRWLYIDGIYIHYVLGHALKDADWDRYQADYGPSPFYAGVR